MAELSIIDPYRRILIRANFHQEIYSYNHMNSQRPSAYVSMFSYTLQISIYRILIVPRIGPTGPTWSRVAFHHSYSSPLELVLSIWYKFFYK